MQQSLTLPSDFLDDLWQCVLLSWHREIRVLFGLMQCVYVGRKRIGWPPVVELWWAVTVVRAEALGSGRQPRVDKAHQKLHKGRSLPPPPTRFGCCCQSLFSPSSHSSCTRPLLTALAAFAVFSHTVRTQLQDIYPLYSATNHSIYYSRTHDRYERYTQRQPEYVSLSLSPRYVARPHPSLVAQITPHIPLIHGKRAVRHVWADSSGISLLRNARSAPSHAALASVSHITSWLSPQTYLACSLPCSAGCRSSRTPAGGLFRRLILPSFMALAVAPAQSVF